MNARAHPYPPLKCALTQYALHSGGSLNCSYSDSFQFLAALETHVKPRSHNVTSTYKHTFTCRLETGRETNLMSLFSPGHKILLRAIFSETL